VTTNENGFRSRAAAWQAFLVHETFEYFINLAYLTLFLLAFAWYRNLILAAHQIDFHRYLMPLIEAAILAKIIMVGDMLHFGRGLENRPLVLITFYRTLVFSVFVLLFSLGEHIADALIHGKTMSDGIAEIRNKGLDEILAWYVSIVAALVPFFAMKEIERVFGVEKVRNLFFRGQVIDAEPPSADTKP
jgi:hypothetical protein